jgi:exodeoxyribonuclease V beta subunit
MPQYHNDFDPSKVVLAQSNLIEASAGTGKTFSIALMAVRLVVEKRIPLEKVLMVTFTKAATAELEDRVRLFIRNALRLARKGVYGSDPLGVLVAGYCDTPEKRRDTEALLSQAQIDLDRLNVRTIHGFCQQVMKEYSFETGQVFGAETLSPEEHDRICADAFHEYWRQRVNVMGEDLLRILLAAGLSREDVFGMVRQGISGKIPAPVETLPGDFLLPSHQARLRVQLAELNAGIQAIREEAYADFEANGQDYLKLLKSHAKTAFGPSLTAGDWPALFDMIMVKIDNDYTKNTFGPLRDRISEAAGLNEELKAFGKRLANLITCAAYEVVAVALQREKAARGVITFDDMILQLAEALRREEAEHGMAMHPESLRSRLRAKFDAVFIDEFQDTDREQYYIFHRIFGMEKILFYIGDPKQSIYGWRKADIFTYFKAAANVDHVHRMNFNRRSNAAMIEAMNIFFKPLPDTDTFAYNGAPDAIEYVNVESPSPNTKGILYHGGTPCVTLRISPFANKKQLRKGFLLTVTDLLRDPDYQILEDGKIRSVEPRDIGILVRTNKEGRAIKEMLSRHRVPAVTIDDSKLFDSDEARELFYVMEAVNDITRANINRALLTRIGGYDLERLRRADEEAILQRFREYKAAWETDGVFVMLRRFLADHGVEDLFTDPGLPNPERTVSNILQLTELIHKVSERRKYDAREQLQWLKKGIDGEIRDGDEYQQRIESDEEAVRIVTIHKSKGLEYNIVIAPHLDFVFKRTPFKTISYRDPNDSLYYTIESDLKSPEQEQYWEEQTEQENRRLLYVAVTRARMACYIQASTANYYSGSTLRYFRNQLELAAPNPAIVDIDWQIDVDNRIVLPVRANASQTVQRVYAEAPSFDANLLQRLWRRTSYSGLSPEHMPAPSPKADGFESTYDEFVFRTIKRGAHTGNLIHYIFERIDFRRPAQWDGVIEKAIKRLSGSQPEAFIRQMKDMLRQVVETIIIPGEDLQLTQVGWEDRLSELEFDFPLTEFATNRLAQLTAGTDTPFSVKADQQLEGIMNGKVDLIFRHGGKYWILDWKSNHLGDRVEDYSVSRVRESMAENNYHLQYHIYTVALRRYLVTRVPDFDYDRDFGGCIYLFVRGMRAGSDTGIFFHKPERALLDRMESLTTGLVVG